MNWSDQIWETISPINKSILEMPFVRELAEGTLSLPNFQFYMAQDSLYLEHFGRALALLAARAHDIEDTLIYTRFAENAIVVENALHESYFSEFGITDKAAMQPACHHYIHFLKSTSALDAVEVGMAATLPCFWIYQYVGDYIHQNHASTYNPYQKWIDTYAGEEFGIAVKQAIACCDRVAAQSTQAIRDKMNAAFIAAAHLEFDFWDAAYNLRSWRSIAD